MAAKATIYKALVNIANIDIHYYQEHNLTLAKHPSENNLRLLVRIIAFIQNANENLAFCKGISEDDEPDLWQKNLGGDIELWIDLGQIDEKRIKKACGKSKKVIIYTYQEGMATAWYKQIEKSLKRFNNLEVIFLNIEGNIDTLVQRSMSLQANISDNELNLINNDETLNITHSIWKSSI